MTAAVQLTLSINSNDALLATIDGTCLGYVLVDCKKMMVAQIDISMVHIPYIIFKLAQSNGQDHWLQ